MAVVEMTYSPLPPAGVVQRAACQAGTSHFDVLTLGLLRTWRQLWAQLGELQAAYHQAGRCAGCPLMQLRRGGRHG